MVHFSGACVTDQKSQTFNPQSLKGDESRSFLKWFSAFTPRDAITILDVSI